MDWLEKAKKRSETAFVEVPVKGLGVVRFKRLKTEDIWDFPDDSPTEDFNMQVLRASVSDDQGRLVFASVKELKKLDWGVVKALSAACHKVNNLDEEEATKNSEGEKASGAGA